MLARAWLWRQDVVRVQKIRVPDTGHLSWIVVDERYRDSIPIAAIYGDRYAVPLSPGI
jgi:hypothetical protein